MMGLVFLVVKQGKNKECFPKNQYFLKDFLIITKWLCFLKRNQIFFETIQAINGRLW